MRLNQKPSVHHLGVSEPHGCYFGTQNNDIRLPYGPQNKELDGRMSDFMKACLGNIGYYITEPLMLSVYDIASELRAKPAAAILAILAKLSSSIEGKRCRYTQFLPKLTIQGKLRARSTPLNAFHTLAQEDRSRDEREVVGWSGERIAPTALSGKGRTVRDWWYMTKYAIRRLFVLTQFYRCVQLRKNKTKNRETME